MAGDDAAIDAAHEAKYGNSSAVPIMQGEQPKATSVRHRTTVTPPPP